MLNLLLTCEHGGNHVPAAFRVLFEGQEQVLASHLGYDIGALTLFHDLQDMAKASFFSETSRLLVDLNRSLHHRNIFSAFTKALPQAEKEFILQQYYYPYRNSVLQTVEQLVQAGGQVLHLAVHTFTPVLNGEQRHADIGLLFDPKRKDEKNFCKNWKAQLLKQDTGLQVRFNYPYLGVADGLPAYLRRKFTDDQYLGIELEVNQCFPECDQSRWESIRLQLKTALQPGLVQTGAAPGTNK
ncbi:N-formylglutamate amidohydrolase [Pontibacter sp. 172403-2]|uniref:N-formylglutamate amidohydrolase n=1 Tax=Pontibacter rufus TaxID=2791028 RepID=UPI0018AF65EC|nr:N-formylglutamate amidohydrolase [Pontibacter sp. 172403-2]MBF9253596.1 N-formylglutamate amidohydrolase [Pontibacter sp. 172403-2]